MSVRGVLAARWESRGCAPCGEVPVKRTLLGTPSTAAARDAPAGPEAPEPLVALARERG